MIEQLGEVKEKKRGRNTKVRFIFVRHSQKKSGRIFEEGTQAVTKSGISEPGKLRAENWGKNRLTDGKIGKAYTTEVDRTRETLEAAFRAAGIDPKLLGKHGDKQAKFFSMPFMRKSKGFTKQYDAIVQKETKGYMDEHYPGKEFDKLSTDEQEEISEHSEEAALEWYLNFDDIKPDEKTVSPREHAAAAAFQINRLINLPDHMPNEKELDDLISAGHKTSTEAFLKYCIVREKDGKTVTGFDSLEEIGGSIKILDSWELLVENDDAGKKSVKLILRRENGDAQEYGLDLSVIHELTKEHVKAKNINVIDSDFQL